LGFFHFSLVLVSRLQGNDEIDGMRTLKRRELCDVINNLKQKLSNAEKVRGPEVNATN